MEKGTRGKVTKDGKRERKRMETESINTCVHTDTPYPPAKVWYFVSPTKTGFPGITTCYHSNIISAGMNFTEYKYIIEVHK